MLLFYIFPLYPQVLPTRPGCFGVGDVKGILPREAAKTQDIPWVEIRKLPSEKLREGLENRF